jgi:hypothetical protein
MNIPKDNKQMTEKYKIETGGCCGQACLAVIEDCSIQEVMNNWKKIGLDFKGYSGWKQLRQYLEKRGFTVKQIKTNKVGFNNFYIIRVQWLGEKENKEKPFYGWGHWSQASAHTHFIVYNKGEIFCNETGIFDYHKLENYLENATVTSALEITKENGNNN